MDSSRDRAYNFSVLKLIEAVKVRPALWDCSCAEFRKKENKDQAWQGVFEEFGDVYRLLNEKEQSEMALKITTKWRNIRDAFIRSVKKRSTDTKMKKYMHYDRLSFMLKLYKSYIRPESPHRQQFDNSDNTYSKTFHEHKAQRSISLDNISENSLDEKPKTSLSVAEESFEDNDEEKLTNDANEMWCSNSRNIVTDFDDEFKGTSCFENKTIKSQNDTVQFQNHQDKKPYELGSNHSSIGKHFENVAILQPDEDEAFLTSILSSLRDMNLDEKLEFRIAVLQKISDIRSKRHNP